MVWHVRGDGVGQQSYTISGLLQLLSSINPPASIAFPSLGNTNATSLLTGQTATYTVNNVARVVRSVGLMTCASIIFLSQNGKGYVLHANAGGISQEQFNAAIQAMEGNAGTTYIVYAHPDNNDPGYTESLNDMVTWGANTNNIAEITNLAITNFGVNNLSQVGF